MVTYPKNWEVKNISELVTIKTGSRDTQDNKPNGRYPFFVRSQTVEHIDLYDFDCEAVLTAGDGVGTGKVFHYINGKFAAHQRVYVMSNFSDVLGKYFYYYFSKNFINEVEKYTAKSSVDSVRRAMIADMEFPFPADVLEQEHIVKALESFDAYIDNLAELIEKKKNIRDGALEDLVTGKTRLEGYEKEWDKQSLKSLSTLITKQTGFDYSERIKESLVTSKREDTIPFIQNKDFEKFNINYDTDFFIPKPIAEMYPKIMLNEKCILISISGRIGNVAVFDNRVTSFSGGAVGVIKLKNPDIAEWCMLYLLSSKGQAQIFKNEKVGAQHNLTVADVRNLNIEIPEESERNEIVDIIRNMDLEIINLTEERDKIIQIRDGAMDDLLTGRIRLKI